MCIRIMGLIERQRSHRSLATVRTKDNNMFHDYFEANLQLAWDAIEQDAPHLQQRVEPLLWLGGGKRGSAD
jgi:uncharacterized protein with HEPN domain